MKGTDAGLIGWGYILAKWCPYDSKSCYLRKGFPVLISNSERGVHLFLMQHVVAHSGLKRTYDTAISTMFIFRVAI